VRVQALERSAVRPSVETRSESGAVVGTRPALVQDGAHRRNADIRTPPALPQALARSQLLFELGDPAARFELAHGAHERPAGEPERGRKRLSRGVVRVLDDHARTAVDAAGGNSGERTRRPAQLTLDRLAVTLRRGFHERKCRIRPGKERRR
jgi:hypothetical protein